MRVVPKNEDIVRGRDEERKLDTIPPWWSPHDINTITGVLYGAFLRATEVSGSCMKTTEAIWHRVSEYSRKDVM